MVAVIGDGGFAMTGLELLTAVREKLRLTVIVLADPLIWVNRVRIAELCAQYKLPSVWGGRDYLLGGGLASYQSDFPDIFRRGAMLADQILKGAKPAEMPFERATRLQLVINLGAARKLGLTVPNALLVAADEVID